MKVLCVDDSPLTRTYMKRVVRRIAPNATALGCRDPEEAVQNARAKGCDVLIAEIELAGSTRGGLDLARKIREINPRVNIIFVTVFSPREYAGELMELHVSGYLTKPLNQEKLTEEFANLRYPI